MLSRYRKYKLKKTDNSHPRFTLEGILTRCKVVDVYDGDTVTITYYLQKKIVKMSCRLFRIDTPELRTTDIKEKEAAKLAKDTLIKLCEPNDKLLYVQFGKMDKYGRPLVTLYNKKHIRGKDKEYSNSINNRMVEMGLALSYDGKGKDKFDFDKFPIKVIE